MSLVCKLVVAVEGCNNYRYVGSSETKRKKGKKRGTLAVQKRTHNIYDKCIYTYNASDR